MAKTKSSTPITDLKNQARVLSRHLPLSPRRASLIFWTPWGWMGVAESEEGIAAIVLPHTSKAAVAAALGSEVTDSDGSSSSSRLREARKQLLEYLAGTRTSFDLSLDLSRGTAFQQRVWKKLGAIPYGQLWSYRGLASRVGGVQYARAVGGAVGANPLPIVLPCHRIVAQDATLGGFSCGLPAKRRLLALEGSLSRLRAADRDR
jgi:methylated-DNA-[protein]-cysteine S-methyltransferase